jgi:hypothetical protein
LLTTAETQTVVSPLNVCPITVGPWANAAPGGMTAKGGKVKAGRVPGVGTFHRAGRADRGGVAVAALASATGAALAIAAMTAATETARIVIRLVRLWLDMQRASTTVVGIAHGRAASLDSASLPARHAMPPLR